MAVHWDATLPIHGFDLDPRVYQVNDNFHDRAFYLGSSDFAEVDDPSDGVSPAFFPAPGVFESGLFRNQVNRYKIRQGDQPDAYWYNEGEGAPQEVLQAVDVEPIPSLITVRSFRPTEDPSPVASLGVLILGPTSEEDVIEVNCSLSFDVQHAVDVNPSDNHEPTRMGAYFGSLLRAPHGSLTGTFRHRKPSVQTGESDLPLIPMPWIHEPEASDIETPDTPQRIIRTAYHNTFFWAPRDGAITFSPDRKILRRVASVSESFLVEYNPLASFVSFGFYAFRRKNAFAFRPRVSISVVTSRLNRELSVSNYSGVPDNYVAES